MSDENLSAADNQSPNLVRSSALVGSLTMVSRVLGLLRDIVIASVFGAGSSSDAFFVAFKVPNFLRRLFAEGAFSQAFVPVLADYKNQGSVAAVRQLLDRVAGVLGGTLLLLTLVAVAAAPAAAAPILIRSQTSTATSFRSDMASPKPPAPETRRVS